MKLCQLALMISLFYFCRTHTPRHPLRCLVWDGRLEFPP